ncbi:MAG: FAD-dependent oxidoreductase, partial [Candidatus Izemoplasmatales bacterium]|nr:FAD-dependent oxidoreductase [Candidatus Izemoplasmatales bacterium]
MDHYDVIVIGGGIAGITVAKKCAYGGLKVLLIERERLGGRSLHGGGTFIHHLFQSVKMINQMAHASHLAIQCDTSSNGLDFLALLDHYQEKKHLLEEVYMRDMALQHVTLLYGKASLLDAHSVRMGHQTFSATDIVLAHGGVLRTPEIDGLKDGLAQGFVLEPTAIEGLKTRPASVVIYGSGRIAYELSLFFLSIGTEVTMLAQSPLLNTFDQDIRVILLKQLESDHFHLIDKAESIHIKDRSIHLILNEEKVVLQPDFMVVATGYIFDHEVLGDVKIDYDEVGIITNLKMQTNIEHIYAVGDCNHKPHLSNIAIEEAEVASKNILGINAMIRYDLFINSLMGLSEYAFIGLSEQDIHQTEEPYYIASFSLDRGKRLYSRLDTPLIKIILSKIRQHILGLHIVGEEAVDEITQLYSLLNPAPLGGVISVPVHSRLYEIKDQIDAIHHEYHQRLIDYMFSAYQKIVDHKTYETVGYESLSRFMIDGKPYPPLSIIQMLERSGYIRLLDMKSVENAITTLNTLKARGCHEDTLHISINIAVHTLTSVSSEHLREMVESAGFKPKNITFEVTERQLLDNQKVLTAMSSLKKSGFRLSLDDFSVGHASLVLLDRFSFDEVKLDRDLLPKDAFDLNNISTYRHLVDILKQRGVEIVSEGIETAFHKDFVRDLEVD